jgi:threonine aldolase
MHSEVLRALTLANEGHVAAYGDDEYTRRLQEIVVEHFGGNVHVFPVFNGTGANVVALQSMLPRWGAAITSSKAHINVDEGGAPERAGGIKLLTVPAPDGKLTPELIDREAWGWGNQHRAQPLVVSITQSTELGTIYTPDEIRAIADHAHDRNMRVHMDGARISNAAAALGVPLRAVTRDVGVDVLSFGGTKNGAMLADAVIVFDDEASAGLAYLRKMTAQLPSKMRFVSAQLIALLEGDLWLRNASHSNVMARQLRAAVESGLSDGTIHGVELSQPTQSNAVFATLPPGVGDRLRRRYAFMDWDASQREVRWVTSFDTTQEDIDSFISELSRLTRPPQ